MRAPVDQEVAQALDVDHAQLGVRRLDERARLAAGDERGRLAGLIAEIGQTQAFRRKVCRPAHRRHFGTRRHRFVVIKVKIRGKLALGLTELDLGLLFLRLSLLHLAL